MQKVYHVQGKVWYKIYEQLSSEAEREPRLPNANAGRSVLVPALFG